MVGEYDHETGAIRLCHGVRLPPSFGTMADKMADALLRQAYGGQGFFDI